MGTSEKFATMFRKYEEEGCRFVGGSHDTPVQKTGVIAWLKSLVKIT